MEIDTTAIVVFVLTQTLQTLQLFAVGRTVKRGFTIKPPPLPPPPLAAPPPAAAYCRNCGNLTASSELTHGLCAPCLGSNPTERPYDDPHAAAERFRRRRG